MKRALTKSQASELLRAVSLLPPASRDQFIDEVDKRLRSVKRQRLTDADVSAAIVSTLTVLNTSCFICDAAPTTGGPSWRSGKFMISTAIAALTKRTTTTTS
jgi:hypothetical protein